MLLILLPRRHISVVLLRTLSEGTFHRRCLVAGGAVSSVLLRPWDENLGKVGAAAPSSGSAAHHRERPGWDSYICRPTTEIVTL